MHDTAEGVVNGPGNLLHSVWVVATDDSSLRGLDLLPPLVVVCAPSLPHSAADEGAISEHDRYADHRPYARSIHTARPSRKMTKAEWPHVAMLHLFRLTTDKTE